MEISSLIGKRILTPSGESLGYTKSAYLSRDRKRFSCLICFDEEEEEFILPARAVLAAEDVIIASRARLKEPVGTPCPIGSPAYSNKGELLGAVSDYIIGGEESEYVIVKDGVSTAFRASSVKNGATLIVYPNGKRKRAPRKKLDAEAQKVPPAQAAPHIEKNAIGRGDLIGKIVKTGVYDKYGNAIAFKGQRITPAVIALARKNNLLLRLSMNTLTDFS